MLLLLWREQRESMLHRTIFFFSLSSFEISIVVVVVVLLPLLFKKGDTGNNTCSWSCPGTPQCLTTVMFRCCSCQPTATVLFTLRIPCYEEQQMTIASMQINNEHSGPYNVVAYGSNSLHTQMHALNKAQTSSMFYSVNRTT